jgi:hypothetical protein
LLFLPFSSFPFWHFYSLLTPPILNKFNHET